MALAGLNDTTADHVVTAVQHRGLPGTEGALWYGEMNKQCVVVEGLNPCRRGRSGIPHFHRDLGGRAEQAAVEEIEVFYEAGGAEQALLWTEHDRIGRRLHTLHIQPLSGGDAESAPLTGCKRQCPRAGPSRPCSSTNEPGFFTEGISDSIKVR